jgi:Transcriptional regulator
MTNENESRSDRKKEENQQKILRIALTLFHERGLAAVSMEQIAEAADFAKGTLYNYFPSKEALINGFMQSAFAQNQEERIAHLRSLADTRSRLSYLFGLLIEGVQAEKELFETFFLYRMKQLLSLRPPATTEQSGLATLGAEVIVLGQRGGELRDDLPLDLLEGLFEYALIKAIQPIYLQPDSFDAERSIAQSIDVFFNGARKH